MEDYAYVLDVLPDGRPDSKRRFRREPVVYGLGIEEFKIFDMEPVTGAAINIGDRCYIGKETEERTQIDHVRARVNFVELTHTAQSELAFVLDEVVKENEEKFNLTYIWIDNFKPMCFFLFRPNRTKRSKELRTTTIII